MEFGQDIESRFANPVATVSGKGNEIKLKLAKKQMVNQIVIAEDIEKGERVREFIIKAKTAGGCEEIYKGSCIGHKFIHRFAAVNVSEIRLQISESKGEPQIKELTLYDIEN
jgi:alpha-L-fucosidase